MSFSISQKEKNYVRENEVGRVRYLNEYLKRYDANLNNNIKLFSFVKRML